MYIFWYLKILYFTKKDNFLSDFLLHSNNFSLIDFNPSIFWDSSWKFYESHSVDVKHNIGFLWKQNLSRSKKKQDMGILLKQNSTAGITISEKLLAFTQSVMQFMSFSKSAFQGLSMLQSCVFLVPLLVLHSLC